MKSEAIKALEKFTDAVRDDRVCPKKALKLANAAANIIMPEPLVQEPVADSQLEKIEQEEAASVEPAAPVVEPAAPVVEETPPVEEAAPVEEEAPTDLLSAINQLDPTNDDHWTQAGAPAISAIEGIYGNQTTRAEVNEVAPGYDRDAAAAK